MLLRPTPYWKVRLPYAADLRHLRHANFPPYTPVRQGLWETLLCIRIYVHIGMYSIPTVL